MDLNGLFDINNRDISITSVNLCKLINELRVEEGNNKVKRHDVLMRDIRNEIEALENSGVKDGYKIVPISYKDNMNREKPCYVMNRAGIMQMLNKESAYVRYKTQQYIEELEQFIIDTNQKDEFLQYRSSEKRDTYLFYNGKIKDSGKCMALSKLLYNITSYHFNFDKRLRKEDIFLLSLDSKHHDYYQFYVDMKVMAEKFLDTFQAMNSEHFMHNTIELVKKQYIDDLGQFNHYIKTHEIGENEFLKNLPNPSTIDMNTKEIQKGLVLGVDIK